MILIYWWLATNFGQSGRWLALVSGAVSGASVGLFFYWRTSTLNTSDDVLPEQAQEIRARCCQAWDRLSRTQKSEYKDSLIRSLRALDNALRLRGPEWLDGRGYLSAWNRLHDVEQNILMIDSPTNVVATGFHDLLRLTTSDIQEKATLLQEIRDSIPHVASNAGSNLNPPVKQPHPSDPETARRRIRNVRTAVNEDRDGKWRQVIRARDGLLLGALLASAISYLFADLAVVVGINPKVLVTAAVLFGVGAAVSAAHQLAIRTASQSEVEDFGFANVKLLTAPLLSGVVAVIAVAVLAQTQITVGPQQLGGGFSSWQATFDWSRNPSAIWVAALFGFSPSLLFAFLQTRVNGTLDSLKSSQASGGGSKQ